LFQLRAAALTLLEISSCWYRDVKAFDHRHIVSFAYDAGDGDGVVGRRHYAEQNE
jgi:hypothetical protein